MRSLKIFIARAKAHRADRAYRNFMARTLANGWSVEIAYVLQKARAKAISEYQSAVLA